ncbi:MAG: hypothetical protein KC621_27410, partial [Myxococcales bacterium]|nr:hypothetical protein [Myxococcales bacterium]
MSGSTTLARGAALAVALLLPTLAHAGDGSVSFGLAGGGLFTDQLEVIGDTVVITPRVGYWINPTLGFELDANIMPAGKTQVGAPDTYPYFALVPAANMVGRVFEDKPLSLLLEVGIGPIFKKVNDNGDLDLPVGTNLDVDFAGIAGPGLYLPFGSSPLGLRTEYRWLLNIGTENWQNHGDAFLSGEWTIGLHYLKNGPKDSDKDGITDDLDQCDDQKEDFDEYMDDDGCPDSDNDSDGIADTDDQCPVEAEDMDGFDDADGCPDP